MKADNLMELADWAQLLSKVAATLTEEGMCSIDFIADEESGDVFAYFRRAYKGCHDGCGGCRHDGCGGCRHDEPEEAIEATSTTGQQFSDADESGDTIFLRI